MSTEINVSSFLNSQLNGYTNNILLHVDKTEIYLIISVWSFKIYINFLSH